MACIYSGVIVESSKNTILVRLQILHKQAELVDKKVELKNVYSKIKIFCLNNQLRHKSEVRFFHCNTLSRVPIQS